MSYRKMFLNRYAWKVREATKDMRGIGRYVAIVSGAAREILAHRFNLWDCVDNLGRNGYVYELHDGARFYIPYCVRFDSIQMTILDIGANIGNHTVFFARNCGALRVFAFEPQRDVYEILARNIL